MVLIQSEAVEIIGDLEMDPETEAAIRTLEEINSKYQEINAEVSNEGDVLWWRKHQDKKDYDRLRQALKTIGENVRRVVEATDKYRVNEHIEPHSQWDYWTTHERDATYTIGCWHTLHGKTAVAVIMLDDTADTEVFVGELKIEGGKIRKGDRYSDKWNTWGPIEESDLQFGSLELGITEDIDETIPPLLEKKEGSIQVIPPRKIWIRTPKTVHRKGDARKEGHRNTLEIGISLKTPESFDTHK